MRSILAVVSEMPRYFAQNALCLRVLLLLLLGNLCAASNVMPATAPDLEARLKAGPRQGSFAKAPGRYDLAARAANQVVEPGGTIVFEVYITGYGEITVSKLFTLIPKDIVEPGEGTYVFHSLGKKERGIYFGAEKELVSEIGGVAEIRGMSTKDWQYSTIFIDRQLFSSSSRQHLDVAPLILTELVLTKSPFEFHFKTLPYLKAGKYVFNFYLTYFNGLKWEISSQQVEVEVPTFLKRHELGAWILGSFLAAIATYSSIINIFNFHRKREAQTKHSSENRKKIK